jgi:hypothetical protein
MYASARATPVNGPITPSTPYLLEQQAVKLLAAVVDPLTVGCVNDPYQRVGLLEVVLPVCAKGLLSSDIP